MSARPRRRAVDRVPEEQRANHLSTLAARLLKAGVPRDALLVTLADENQRVCDPPLNDDEIVAIAQQADASDAGDDANDSTVLVRIATEGEVDFFHDRNHETFATIRAEDHVATWSLRQSAYKNLLAKKFFALRGKAPANASISDAINVLTGRALHDGPMETVWIRVGEHEGRLYLDLTNDAWEVIEITTEGWQLTRTPPIRFKRTRGMLPLPHPKQGGSLESLRGYLNVATDDDYVMVVAWLIGAVRPHGPHVVLVLQGEQGSAKSTTARVLRSTIDPNVAAVRSFPHEERDLMVAANNSWVVVFDNVSRIPPWLSDSLCRLATGGGFGKRESYTDLDEIIIEAQRPVILNGIEEIITRGDLMDRSLVFTLPRILAADRKTEREFWQEFEQQRPLWLGALLDVVVVALQNVDSVTLLEAPRMADFATWITAAEAALNWPPGTFMRAYMANLEASRETVLEASPVAEYVRRLAEEGWSGPAHKLLVRLEAMATEAEKRHYGWPKSPLALSNTLQRLAPMLAEVGVEVLRHREGKLGTRIIRIRRSEVPE